MFLRGVRAWQLAESKFAQHSVARAIAKEGLGIIF
jgi:hypothetical protein